MAFSGVFDDFRQNLDEYNDRRERLIKISRDVTNLSKKIIFLVHRLMMETASGGTPDSESVAKRSRDKLQEVQSIYARMNDEVPDEQFWRYHQTISPGLQEYIEALSFTHYIQYGTLITYGQVRTSLSDDNGVPFFPLPLEDYLLGLSDLTGELMRYAISGIARRGGRAKAGEVCAFVRHCKADFERLCPYVRGLSKKQVVTAQSLEKIEDAVYAIVVRGSEYDLPPEMLDEVIARTISSFSSVVSKQKPGHRGRGSDDEYEDDY
ncbi:hypothetical protein SERLA73DRAFT_175199 [Serpula lacrymans var. lacrymans S7.3]|uniref:Translin n=2 Tax=Serpula lacrymans var. lacrymans TaxID=341189 RepID=F8PL02_SERL3|nr:uncharacterized protein SERLADRAFT_457345 [Serpula lacrymans var. lacrymans S7.9]EGO03646.1 hypothetical protein SERLA73DRAFT_175199 [Serpula lacrymans var. lacrymans S7.3]EGO29512.1 hypothetical protein SERLADRAFT_457345 [Serpula lacrymans var. lacrymans S7.9]